MESCRDGTSCEAPGAKVEARTPCPRCGVVGRVVDDETIQAMLDPVLAVSLLAVERRVCRTPTCDMLYYGVVGALALKTAARVRVGFKEIVDPIPLCYCFNFSRADIRGQVARTGDSTIPADVTARIRAGECACEIKNPSGACCLGDLNKAVKEAKDALAAARRALAGPAAGMASDE